MEESCSLVVFGATGDLAKRKLFPSLYSLLAEGLLPKKFSVIGIGRSAPNQEAFVKDVLAAVKKNAKRSPKLDLAFTKLLTYHQMDVEDNAGYKKLATLLHKLNRKQTMFYLATASSFFKTIVQGLHKHRLVKGNKVLFEKPFGHDLKSARELNEDICAVFPEEAVFRIDHYLGKDSVQNILVLRFANTLFEPLWNHQFIDNIQITVAESLGVEGRGQYYEHAGAFRDIVQNHMLHLLMLVAMEPPTNLSAAAIHDEKVKVLKSVKPMLLADIKKNLVLGQYGAGKMGKTTAVAYRAEQHVAKRSKTETYVALKLHIDNWRWRGTPFYVRTGKRLRSREADIRIQFRSVPEVLFNMKKHLINNEIVIKLQPEAGVAINFNTKSPGKQLEINPVNMDFCQDCLFGANTPEAYEQLFMAAMRGDHTLFARWDEVEASWELSDPILQSLQKLPLHNYKAGSMGPKAADSLLEKEGRQWLL